MDAGDFPDWRTCYKYFQQRVATCDSCVRLWTNRERKLNTGLQMVVLAFAASVLK